MEILHKLNEFYTRFRLHRLGPMLLLLTLGFSSMVWLLFNTPWGVRVGYDSIFYLDAAANIANGTGAYWVGSGGVLKPLTHFPPLYPALLSLPMAFSLDPIAAGRFVAAFLLGLNVFLVGLLLYRPAKRFTLALFGMLWIFSSPVILELHFRVMSEPLFFTCMLLTLLFVSEFLRTRAMSYLLLGAATAACGMLTRYTGSVLIVCCVLAILILHGGPKKQKFFETGVFAGVALLPIGAWALRNYSLASSATNRTFVKHVVDLVEISREILDVLFAWIVPTLLSHWLETAIILATGIVIAMYLFWQSRVQGEEHERDVSLAALLFVYPPIYLAQLLISLSFFDASTPIDDRILSPIFFTSSLLILSLLSTIKSRRGYALFGSGVLVLTLLHPLPSGIGKSQRLVNTYREDGRGFTSRTWQESRLVEWIRSSDPDSLIVTNEAMPVRFLTNLTTYQIPEQWDPVKDQEREDYQEQLEVILDVLKSQRSYLVLFDPGSPSNLDDAIWLDDLSLVFETNEGVIYSSYAE